MATVTMSDVARAVGVSVMTVSNVINGRPSVGAETRLRVLDVIDELGYEVNLSAKRLRSGRTNTLALVVPRFDHPYFGELASRLVAAFEVHGRHVVVEQSGASREGELSALSHARLRMYDGVILSVVGLSYDDVDRLRTDAPIVLLGEQDMPPRFDLIRMSNVEGARLATAHLLARGARRVAVIGGEPPDRSSTSDGVADPRHRGMSALRTEGWRQALLEHGLEPDPQLIVELAPHEPAQAYEAVAAALASGLGIDGVFAVTDQVALGALAALHDSALHVPGAVGVVGFDNLSTSRYLRPSLTSIDPHNDWIVEQTVRLLERRLAASPEQPSPEPEHLLAPVTLVSRGSTR